MLIKQHESWHLNEAQATPEEIFINRRGFIAGAGALVGSIAATPFAPAFGATAADPSAALYPVKRNPAFTLERAITPEKVNAAYNNFYEFGSHKGIAKAAQALPIRPWQVRIDGDVEKDITIDIDELLAKMPLEERLYRHRCVEAWSMTIPWSGFALKALVDFARPLSSAKYLRMETFHKPKIARGQRQTWYPWPYVEGVSLAEATNDLAFLATGAYGKPAAKQFGAPLRLALPWKYGFKSIKSIVRFTFTAKRPVSFWEEINAREYGFWANVNPKVSHPRWSQASERVLGTNERIATRLFNGYGEQVADLYTGLKSEKLFM